MWTEIEVGLNLGSIRQKGKIYGNSKGKKINQIRDEYPETFKWMQHRASWEHITLGAVLNGYEDYIDELIQQEEEQ